MAALICLVASGCADSTEDGVTADPPEVTATSPRFGVLEVSGSAEEPPTGTTGTADVTGGESARTVATAEPLPILSFSPLSTGSIEVTASRCTIDGIADGVPNAAARSLAVGTDWAFLAIDAGVAALGFVAGEPCSLRLDPAIGDGGFLVTADRTDSVALSATGRLVASGLFSTTVFDLDVDRSFVCERVRGDIDISADGAQVMTSFPGSPVEQFAVSDAACGDPVVASLPSEIVDTYFAAYAATTADPGTERFVGGLGSDGAVYAARSAGATVEWKVGNPEIGAMGWIGWVHAMVPCSAGYCILDTNTDKLIVTDGAGAVRAEFSMSDLIGERLFFETAEVGPDGAIYVLGTAEAADGLGGTNESSYVLRLEITG